MVRLARRLLAMCVAAVVMVLVVVLAPASPAGAAASKVGGLELRFLPRHLGTSAVFRYRFQGVGFMSRVWESGSDTRGWRVDLDVTVMRSRRLTTPRALRDWFIRYEDRPANEVHYRPARVHGHRGWVTNDEIFWLMRPHLAVAITIDRHRWSHRALLRAARGVRVWR